MDNDQAGIFLLLVVLGAGLYLYSNGSLGGGASGDSDDAGDSLTGALGSLGDLMNGSAPAANTSNRQAFLAMIGQSEVGQTLIDETDSGYNVLCGATASNPLTFPSYASHPDILNQALDSTAAGLYQINYPTWQTLSRQTGLTDFSPSTQDSMALQLVSNKGALSDVDAGNFASAVQKCSGVWASLPGNSYGQPTNTLATLQSWFENAGGILS
jgi:muramidase (phage lysozyme)